MLQKAITYTNFDGNRVTENFHFHLNKAEIAELELSKKGGLAAYLRDLIQSDDGGAILQAFKELIMASVGRRSEDGRRFEKSKDITDDFIQTGAYSEFLMELAQDADAAADFFRAIVPSDMATKMDQAMETVELPKNKEYSDDELLAMSQEEFEQVAGSDPKHMSRRHLMIAFQRKNQAA
jgi:hypothetical protein